jgi:hypothetical protein
MDTEDGDGPARPLYEIDAALAERFVVRLVDRFLAGAGLSASHRTEAISRTEVFVIADGDGSMTLEVGLPLGAGNPGYTWDGSVVQAEAIADNAADRSIEDVRWDQKNVGLTGWEPQFDAPEPTP